MSWSVWLASQDDYIQPDNDSLISLSSMGALSTVADPNWLEVPIQALDPGYEEWVEGAIAQARIYDFQTRPLIFPDDITLLDNIYAIFRKRFVYLCIDGDGQSDESKYPLRIHPAGSCIAVHRDNLSAPSHNHDEGIKIVSIKFREVRAII